MMPVATTAGGQTVSTGPDVCLTPLLGDLPVPYVNTAMLAATTGTATKVFVECMPVVIATSIIPMSSGDELGSDGGVVSGVNVGQVEFATFSEAVFCQGAPVVRLNDVTGQNGSAANVPGQVVSVAQGKVFIAR
jgi:Domain of unknown function (DUF4150)